MADHKDAKRPRIWPSLAVGAGVLVLAGVVSNVLLHLVISPNLEPNQEFGQAVIDAWMQQNRVPPTGFFTMVTPTHLSVLLLALVASTRSRRPIVERLGLVRGTALPWHYPVLMLSSLDAAAISG